LEKFLDPDSKIGYHFLDDQKIWARKAGSKVLSAWKSMQKFVIRKIEEAKAKLGISYDIEQTYAEVLQAAEDFEKHQNAGSEEAATEAEQKLSTGMNKLEIMLQGEELFYECGEEDTEDCKLEWADAEREGDIKGFCFKCASEVSRNPFRARCNMCCSKCGGRAYSCGSKDTTDCLSEFENAEKKGDVKIPCIRCAKEGGESPFRSHCSKCCSKCHAPIRKPSKAEL